jgi:hypothetical protein
MLKSLISVVTLLVLVGSSSAQDINQNYTPRSMWQMAQRSSYPCTQCRFVFSDEYRLCERISESDRRRFCVERVQEREARCWRTCDREH